jgi:hypothetical protein
VTTPGLTLFPVGVVGVVGTGLRLLTAASKLGSPFDPVGIGGGVTAASKLGSPFEPVGREGVSFVWAFAAAGGIRKILMMARHQTQNRSAGVRVRYIECFI